MKHAIIITLRTLPMLLLGATAQAHHSGAMFDMMNCRNLEGTVRALQWNYPHSWLWIEVPQGDGTNVAWGFEGPSPTQLEHIDPRWTRTVVSKGDKVSVKFGPLKDGRNGGAMAVVSLSDGRVLIGSPGLCEGKPNPNPTADKASPPPPRQP